MGPFWWWHCHWRGWSPWWWHWLKPGVGQWLWGFPASWMHSASPANPGNSWTSHQKRSGEAKRWSGDEIWSCYLLGAPWIFEWPQSHRGGWRQQYFRASQVSCIDNSTLRLFKLLCSCSFIFSWERIYFTCKAFQHLVFFSYQNFHGADHLLSCSFLVLKIWH